MQKILKVLVSSLILFSLTGCPKDPNITVCISSPLDDGMWCSKGGGDKFLLKYDKTENYIAMPEDDARTIFERCNNKNQ